MKRIIYVLFAILTGCSSPHTKITWQIELADSLKDAAVESIELFSERYGPVDSLTIRQGTIREPLGYDHGLLMTAAAYTNENGIFLNSEYSNVIELKSCLEHELFHEMKSFKRAYFKERYSVSNGYSLIGSNGLSAVIWNKEKNDTFEFNGIEEAGADMCAAGIDKSFVNHSNQYYYWGLLLQRMIEPGWISFDQLIDLQKNNGLKKFCSIILRKDENSLNTDDMFLILNAFTDSKDEISLNSSFELIKLRRN